MQEAANPFIKRDLYSLQNTSFAAASTLAFRADLLYAQNIISRWHLASRHGILGESTIEDLFLNQRLGESVSGGWKLISARTPVTITFHSVITNTIGRKFQLLQQNCSTHCTITCQVTFLFQKIQVTSSAVQAITVLIPHLISISNQPTVNSAEF